MKGEGGSPVPVVSLPAEGGRPQAGLEFVEKLLPTKLTSTDTTERDAGMLLLVHPRPASAMDRDGIVASGPSLRCFDT
jgi:hypothetical protein